MYLLAECSLHSLTVSVVVASWNQVAAEGLVVTLRPHPYARPPHCLFGHSHPLTRLFGRHLRAVERDDRRLARPTELPVYEPAGSFPEPLLAPSLSAHVEAEVVHDAAVSAFAVINPPRQPSSADVLPDWLVGHRPEDKHSYDYQFDYQLRHHGKWNSGFRPPAVAVADALRGLTLGPGCRSVATEGTGLAKADTVDTLAGLRLFAEVHPDLPLRVVVYRPSLGQGLSVVNALPSLYVSYAPFTVSGRFSTARAR